MSHADLGYVLLGEQDGSGDRNEVGKDVRDRVLEEAGLQFVVGAPETKGEEEAGSSSRGKDDVITGEELEPEWKEMDTGSDKARQGWEGRRVKRGKRVKMGLSVYESPSLYFLCEYPE